MFKTWIRSVACTTPVLVTTWVVLTLGAVSATQAAFARPSVQDLAAFAWLEGEWERTTRRGVAVERWTRVEGVGLVGEAVLVPAGTDTEVHTEALLLVTMGADTFYIARPPENAYPTGFRLVSHADDTAVFENPTHDFPQRIIYRRPEADAMTVSIEGPGDGGQVQRIDFEFTRR